MGLGVAQQQGQRAAQMSAPSSTPDAAGGFAAPTGSALSGEMQKCLTEIAAGDGTVTRYPGGFWYPAGNGRPSFGTTTIEAIVKRGRLEYVEWKQSHGRQFPIKARLTPNEKLTQDARP